jgi:outer membrane lipoprotein-sorting protein
MNDELKLSGRLGQAVEEIKETPVPTGPLAEALAATRHAIALAETNEDVEEGSGITKRLWEAVMRHKPFSLAASVAILGAIAALLLIGRAGSGLAFADALAEISTRSSFSYTNTIQSDGKPDYANRVMRLDLSHRREIRPEGIVLVFDLAQTPNRVLTLVPYAKYAYEEVLDGTGPRRDPDLLGLLEAYEGEAESLGSETMDGRTVEGFHFGDAVNDWTGWFDPATKLPVRIELLQSGIGRTTVMDDFNFSTPLDPSLFSAEVPEGYHSTESVSPFAFTETVEHDGKTVSSKRVFQKSPTQRREVSPDGDINVVDMSQRPVKILRLKPKQKKCEEITVATNRAGGDPDIFAMAAMAQGPDGQELGAREVSGIQALGFRELSLGTECTYWVDPETRLPVRIEILKTRNGRKIVMSDFEYNVDVDPAFFDTTAPEGYTVEKKEVTR